MKDGIHIPALAVRIASGLMVVALAAIVWGQVPEARRYLKIETM